jgi:hypothetical protein
MVPIRLGVNIFGVAIVVRLDLGRDWGFLIDVGWEEPYLQRLRECAHAMISRMEKPCQIRRACIS